ncbi:hypothetical protein HY623_03470 [Candidatus Uhrbacteria bacterium]|nr:hypothetical protein [Candidatus Uhrbacteria bacterium]
MSNDLIKNADIQHIADQGAKIYGGIKDQYDPKERGKFLAIDIESRDVYLGETSAEALERALEQHPHKIFYVVKIGYDVAETVAHSFSKTRQ